MEAEVWTTRNKNQRKRSPPQIKPKGTQRTQKSKLVQQSAVKHLQTKHRNGSRFPAKPADQSKYEDQLGDSKLRTELILNILKNDLFNYKYSNYYLTNQIYCLIRKFS